MAHAIRPASATYATSRNGASSSPLDDGESLTPSSSLSILLDYLNAIRPVTIIQAVGALIVWHLALSSGQTNPMPAGGPSLLAAASASVYLSYGAGMVMNDLVDVETDGRHSTKSDRAIASGRISKRVGRAYTLALSSASLLLGWKGVNPSFALWTLSNLVLMLGYALGLQRAFLVKNALCGWLAISPLIGAALINAGGGSIGVGSSGGLGVITMANASKLWRLAAVGFPMHVSREILKDVEDVDVDRGNKSTLPLVVGEKTAHRIAYGIVAFVCSIMIFTPLYWGMFESRLPIYPMGVLVGLPMCVRASSLPLSEGQRLLKRSIYVLLAGMIGGLLTQ